MGDSFSSAPMHVGLAARAWDQLWQRLHGPVL